MDGCYFRLPITIFRYIYVFYYLFIYNKIMEHEMRKYIDTFKVRLTENLNISDVRQRFIYLLSSDGHRDSVSLDRGSLDIEGLKKLLIDEQKEYFGYDVIEESIKVEDKGT